MIYILRHVLELFGIHLCWWSCRLMLAPIKKEKGQKKKKRSLNSNRTVWVDVLDQNDSLCSGRSFMMSEADLPDLPCSEPGLNVNFSHSKGIPLLYPSVRHCGSSFFPDHYEFLVIEICFVLCRAFCLCLPSIPKAWILSLY